MGMRKFILLSSVTLSMFTVTQPVSAQDRSTYYSLPEQDLADALRGIARTSDHQLVADAKSLKGQRAPSLAGAYTVEEALTVLLARSGLTAEIRDRTITLRGRDTPSREAVTGATDIQLSVTGSRIRGAKPVSPVITASREKITQLGHYDLGSFIRSIPQNFTGGQNPGVISSVQTGSENTTVSSTINLRGLGADATLTLLMEAATNFLNSIQVNDCRLANRMVQIAKGDDNMSGIIEEMTGYKSVKQGFAKSYQQSREKIQANQNNPTEDLKDALANCPAEVTDIFRTGSLLSHAATRVGAGDWAGVMRARVGDVYMRWDATDKVPIFSAIPACPHQDSESSQDFLSGKVQSRALAMPPTATDCAADGGKGALALAQARMNSIATKIRTRAALSAEERQFVANVRTLPVYRLLEWGVRQGVSDSVIADTDELVALTLAYQMLNDLTQSIDFAVSNAERGANVAGAADGTNANICQTRILTKGMEQLRDLRDEVLRQRAQMRQSYMAALAQANLSANYASLLRTRDRDAREATGTVSGTNR